MQPELASRARPPITLIGTEAETLFELALAPRPGSSMAAELLLQELDRAETYEKDEVPPHVATMLSHVVFLDERTGDRHEVQLVYPGDADAELHRISVLTPIGAALIGMPRGASIDWPNRSGAYRRLRVLEVRQPGARP